MARGDRPPADGVRTAVTVAVVIVVALTVLGMIAFWPRGKAPDIGNQPTDYSDGTIVQAKADDTCTDIEVPDTTTRCVTYDVHLTSGSRKGGTARFAVRPTQTEVPTLHVGDKIVLRYFPDSPKEFRYAFADFQRTTPLLGLLIG